MTTTELRPADPVVPEPPSRRSRSWWALAAGVLVAALTVVWALVVKHDDHGHLLLRYDGVNETWRLSVGTTAFAGANVQPRAPRSGHHVVLLRVITPRVTVNTAHATVRVMECAVANPHEGVGLTPLNVGRRVCTSLRPFRPGPVDLGFPATEIAYIVTPTTPGRVRIEGADVSYFDGLSTVEQHAGGGFVLYVKS